MTNRARWIVRGSRDDLIDRVSANDSGERRSVTRDYAVEHVQLACASMTTDPIGAGMLSGTDMRI